MSVIVALFGLVLLIIVVVVTTAIVRGVWRALTSERAAMGRRLESRASVRCKHCGQDNPDEAFFCGNCGTCLVVF